MKLWTAISTWYIPGIQNKLPDFFLRNSVHKSNETNQQHEPFQAFALVCRLDLAKTEDFTF